MSWSVTPQLMVPRISWHISGGSCWFGGSFWNILLPTPKSDSNISFKLWENRLCEPNFKAWQHGLLAEALEATMDLNQDWVGLPSGCPLTWQLLCSKSLMQLQVNNAFGNPTRSSFKIKLLLPKVPSRGHWYKRLHFFSKKNYINDINKNISFILFKK